MPEHTILRMICQFCGAHYGNKDGEGITGDSHGVCQRCKDLPQSEQMDIYHKRIMFQGGKSR